MAFGIKQTAAGDAPDLQTFIDLAVQQGLQQGYTMDFSERSIADVEVILSEHADLLAQRAKEEKPEEMARLYWGMAFTWGAYLGETLRRQCLTDYVWQHGESNVPMLARGNNGVFPIDKALKRLQTGDPGESVSGFYGSTQALRAIGKL